MERKELRPPLSESDVRGLHAGDEVLVTGIVVTGRDRAHRWLVERTEKEEAPLELAGGILYHCGPLVRKVGERYEMVSCGPTTSARMSPFTEKVLQRYGVRALVGKGGMSGEVGEALVRFGAVYLSVVGGAGALLAGAVEEVVGVHKLEEFGPPEAMWVLRVREMPAVVTMDAHGESVHEEVERHSREMLGRILGEV